MPTFDTPGPISVAISLIAGDVRITASDRSDTVVTVSPSDSSKESDVSAAQQTRVEYGNGRLLIRAPRNWKQYMPFSGDESIDVAIELPAGSNVEGEASAADFRCAGRLGECRFTTAAGSIRLDDTGPLHLTSSAGRITVNRVAGRAEVSTAGEVSITRVDGPATIKNLNGATRVGEVTGDLRCSSANGDISIDRALAAVDAKTASGSVRVGEVRRGSVALGTAFGDLEVGIREGTAARLDLRTQFGRVHNSLTASDGPQQSEQTVEVRARTSYGDIVIRRSEPSPRMAEITTGGEGQ